MKEQLLDPIDYEEWKDRNMNELVFNFVNEHYDLFEEYCKAEWVIDKEVY